MEKYKVCPGCGAHNNPLLLECLECETDLQTVPVTDDTTAAEEILNDSKEAPLVRLCDCGAVNPVQARRCEACGEDISMVVPAPAAPQQAVHYVLAAVDGSFAHELQPGQTVVGREHGLREYLADKMFVSRRHAVLALDLREDSLCITNYSGVNFTYVNGRKLLPGDSASLQDGDEIGLGGNCQDGSRQSGAAYFLVRIGPCM